MDREKLRQQLTEVEAKIFLLGLEKERLHNQRLDLVAKLWQVEPEPIFHKRKCHICGELTNEKFGERTQCIRHTKGGLAIVNILNELENG